MTNPFIRKMETLRPLSDHGRRKLEELVGRAPSFAPHAAIARQGGNPHLVNVVLSGWACRYKLLPDGRRQIIALFLPGDMCDPYVFLFRALDHTIGTLTPAVIAQVPAHEIRELSTEAPEIAEALWWQMLLAVETQREWTVNLGRRTALERLAHLFCEISTRLALVGLSDGVRCECPLTQTDMADILGLSTVHVNRSVQRLRSDGLVELRNKRFTILERHALEELAMFDPTYLHSTVAYGASSDRA